MQYPASTICTLEMYLHPPSKRQAPQLPSSPPLQLLNLQECAEVIYLKWPLLFLILI